MCVWEREREFNEFLDFRFTTGNYNHLDVFGRILDASLVVSLVLSLFNCFNKNWWLQHYNAMNIIKFYFNCNIRSKWLPSFIQGSELKVCNSDRVRIAIRYDWYWCLLIYKVETFLGFRSPFSEAYGLMVGLWRHSSMVDCSFPRFSLGYCGIIYVYIGSDLIMPRLR